MPAPPRPASLRQRLRRGLAWLHLWLGLSVGTLLALVSLAGSVLVFHTTLLGQLQPALMQHKAVADGHVLDTILADWGAHGLRSLDLPRAELPVWQGYFADGSRGYFAPESGDLLLVRDTGNDPLMWLHHWHVELLGGESGKQLLGIVGWIALGMLLSGLYLWWPRRGQWRAGFKLHTQPPSRRWLSWHRVSGVLLLPLLLLAVLTGTGMIYSAGFRQVLTSLFGGEPAAVELPPSRVSANDFDGATVLLRAQRAWPDGRISRVSTPKAGVVTLRARGTGEWHPVGRSQIQLGGDGNGRVIVDDARRHRLGSRIHHAIYPLHIGSVGGAWMRWATALAGLMPAFLLVSGFLFWRRRRGVR
ncbi:PepSY-associated TM helix domain-containing protein [Pseudoxanthomonas dokdonensis]|uniref:PepSY domain-containing protein n=1 Tax=Pseudoxanthomonas dokdonensis TaxID=344882 RepID=A0A0R0CWM1_9GAMM|nr:PepSY-associated TM helix domain-containing protein [Pseudoxanthomonas dokdonensis]KRG70116.1 hypothetical protein ABB29_07790 [Pseudoxanthomonas dokdonensis]